MSVGNDAWAMIALLRLYDATRDVRYLNAGRRLGDFIRGFRNDAGTYQGFQGGLDNPESQSPARRPWASAEHNIDVYAAFMHLFWITGESSWRTDALHARTSVEQMWDSGQGCFLAGTTDPEHRNQVSGQLPVDVQAWSVLGLPGILVPFPGVLTCATNKHQTTDLGFTGFDFNEDGDGVWFEGTAHVAAAHAFAGNATAAETLRATLRTAQATAPFGDGFGIAAAAHDGVTTGFSSGGGPFLLYRRIHVGATAWNAFAQAKANPYYLPEPAHGFSIVAGCAGLALLALLRRG